MPTNEESVVGLHEVFFAEKLPLHAENDHARLPLYICYIFYEGKGS